MADIQSIKKILADVYGIRSDRELNEALENMEKLNIGAMVAPVISKGGTEHELCIA